MTNVMVQDKVCWVCGKPFTQENPQTMHHTLPQQLSPAHNVVVPLHKSCHNKVTSMDNSSLTAYAYRIERTVDESKKSIEGLIALLGKQQFIKITGRKPK